MGHRFCNRGYASTELDITNNASRRRWEVTLDGRVVAFADYRDKPGRVIFTHTEVDPEHEGKGIASRLAKAALDDAVERDLRITLYCPFIRSYVDRHPEYEPSIDPPARS